MQRYYQGFNLTTSIYYANNLLKKKVYRFRWFELIRNLSNDDADSNLKPSAKSPYQGTWNGDGAYTDNFGHAYHLK